MYRLGVGSKLTTCTCTCTQLSIEFNIFNKHVYVAIVILYSACFRWAGNIQQMCILTCILSLQVLFLQFKVFLNFYFLVVAITQLVPQLKIGYWYTYWGPLVCIVFVIMKTL